MSPWNTPRLIGKVDDEEVFPSVSGTVVYSCRLMRQCTSLYLNSDRILTGTPAASNTSSKNLWEIVSKAAE